MSEPKRLVELCNLQWPDDINERFSPKDRPLKELKKQYPGKEIYSYWTIAGHVWTFLREQLGLTCFAPPLIIDRRTDKSLPRAYDEEGNPVTWIIGAFNHSGVLTSHSNECGKSFNPFDYEVRIFHENLLKEIQTTWGDHPTEIAVILTVTQTLFHEFCHYIMLYWKYLDSLDNTQESLQALLDYIRDNNSITDEYANEEVTLRMFSRYWLGTMYHLMDLGDIGIGESYDMWRRQYDDDWLLIATYIQMKQLQNKMTITAADDPNVRVYDKQLNNIYRCHDKLMRKYRKHAVDFVLID